jgi:hypothetical protein
MPSAHGGAQDDLRHPAQQRPAPASHSTDVIGRTRRGTGASQGTPVPMIGDHDKRPSGAEGRRLPAHGHYTKRTTPMSPHARPAKADTLFAATRACAYHHRARLLRRTYGLLRAPARSCSGGGACVAVRAASDVAGDVEHWRWVRHIQVALIGHDAGHLAIFVPGQLATGPVAGASPWESLGGGGDAITPITATPTHRGGPDIQWAWWRSPRIGASSGAGVYGGIVRPLLVLVPL